MKKLTIAILALIFSAGSAFSQPVSDMGIIPIGVTLNSILRLNIVSGGNIEFVFSEIADYNTGIINSTLYDTHFNVSSSIDFDVYMYAEILNFTGVDNPANFFPVDNVAYYVEAPAGGENTFWDIPTFPLDVATLAALNATNTTEIISGITGAAAGDAVKNDFTIHWEIGTPAAVGLSAAGLTLLEQSNPADRYTVNVFLELAAWD